MIELNHNEGHPKSIFHPLIVCRIAWVCRLGEFKDLEFPCSVYCPLEHFQQTQEAPKCWFWSEEIGPNGQASSKSFAMRGWLQHMFLLPVRSRSTSPPPSGPRSSRIKRVGGHLAPPDAGGKCARSKHLSREEGSVVLSLFWRKPLERGAA